MAILSTDILFRLSGGVGNADPTASLGGVESATNITDATVGNLFDNVSGAESSAGDTEYRCFYVHNNHATLTLQTAVIYIQTNTPSADTDISIGLDPIGVNGVATTVANEGTAPAGVVFSQPSSGAPLNIGNIAAGQKQAVWVKRVVSAGAAAVNADSVILKVQGDTAA
jgi:hypothetical protein